MVYCSNCGTEISDDASFCQKCGARTPIGIESGVEPHWRVEVENALQASVKYIEEGVKKAIGYIQEGVRELGPELEQVREGLKEVVEDLGEELRGASEAIKKRTKMAPVICPECGEKNPGNAKFCTKCGKKIKHMQ